MLPNFYRYNYSHGANLGPSRLTGIGEICQQSCPGSKGGENEDSSKPKKRQLRLK